MGTLGRIADAALDRTVVGGFSRIGFKARSLFWSDDDPAPGSLTGRTVVVTGATSGIGEAIGDGAARLGAHVVLVGRNAEHAERIRGELSGRYPDATVTVELGDVSDPDQVQDLSTRLAAHGVDAIVHNAGVMPPERTETADGHELSLATHVLGPLRLTERLLPHLSLSPDPRVVFMSSGGMYTAELPVGDIEFRTGEYNGTRAYARTKRIQVALLPILADRWSSAGVTVAGMHPGWVDTPGLADSLPGFASATRPLLRSAAEGADTAVWLIATEPAPPTGEFFEDRRARPEHFLPSTKYSAAALRSVWDDVRHAAGLDR